MCDKSCGKAVCCKASKKMAKELDKRAETLCYQGLQGLAVGIFDLSKIDKECRKLIASVPDTLTDAEIVPRLYQFALSLPGTRKTM